jgi:hypothetical protein
MPTLAGARPVVLVVTQIDDPTADLVIAELNRRGLARVVRLDPGDFPHDVVLAGTLDTANGRWQGELRTTSREVDLGEVRAVYWRRPSLYQFPGLSSQDREFAAVQAKEGFGGVLTSLDCRYVNHPHRNWVAEYKPPSWLQQSGWASRYRRR